MAILFSEIYFRNYLKRKQEAENRNNLSMTNSSSIGLRSTPTSPGGQTGSIASKVVHFTHVITDIDAVVFNVLYEAQLYINCQAHFL